MKHLLLLCLFMACLISFSFVGHKHQLISTSMRITVLNSLGNPVENAEVTLFRNEKDYVSEENAVVGPEKTDIKGRVTFKKLEVKAYYVKAVKGEESNYGEGELTGVLQKGKVNKLNIVIQ